MLEELGIDSRIPATLTNLAQYAGLRPDRQRDGPGVLTYIRNNLVHPPNLPDQVGAPHYQAYILAQWYVETTVLAACGYCGFYNDRTKSNRWEGEVDLVPWVKHGPAKKGLAKKLRDAAATQGRHSFRVQNSMWNAAQGIAQESGVSIDEWICSLIEKKMEPPE